MGGNRDPLVARSSVRLKRRFETPMCGRAVDVGCDFVHGRQVNGRFGGRSSWQMARAVFVAFFSLMAGDSDVVGRIMRMRRRAAHPPRCAADPPACCESAPQCC
eukprot:17892-Chlamydomonas_euryale.AAC.1